MPAGLMRCAWRIGEPGVEGEAPGLAPRAEIALKITRIPRAASFREIPIRAVPASASTFDESLGRGGNTKIVKWLAGIAARRWRRRVTRNNSARFWPDQPGSLYLCTEV